MSKIRKTEAIVLNTRKYGDTSLLCAMYTREYGRQNFLIKGFRSAKSRKRHSYFQPMSLLDIVFYFKETRDLQLITETRNAFFYSNLQTDPIKITLGMVMTEVFFHAVKEEEQNHNLFDFLKGMLVHLDELEKGLIQVFVYFLLHLTRYLGFFPDNQVTSLSVPVYFDLEGGKLVNAMGAHTADRLVARFCDADLETCQEIYFDNVAKSELINSLLRYYQFHVEGFRMPESLKVLSEVFA